MNSGDVSQHSRSEEEDNTDDTDSYNETNGSIDDLRIYDRALSATEVLALYELEKVQETEPEQEETEDPYVPVYLTSFDHSVGLIAHYPFDGNASDASGNGRDGTMIEILPLIPPWG